LSRILNDMIGVGRIIVPAIDSCNFLHSSGCFTFVFHICMIISSYGIHFTSLSLRVFKQAVAKTLAVSVTLYNMIEQPYVQNIEKLWKLYHKLERVHSFPYPIFLTICND